jgi:hypothetical protein
MARISKNLSIEKEILEMVETIATKENRSFTNTLETAIKEYYKNNIKEEYRKDFITIGPEFENFKVLIKDEMEITDDGYGSLNILEIIADENIKYEEFNYNKGDIIYKHDDEEHNNLNKTIFSHQYIDEDE